MKTMTCKELGGPCKLNLTAETWEEIVKKMTAHVIREHPDTAKEMGKLRHKDPNRWGRETKPQRQAKPQA